MDTTSIKEDLIGQDHVIDIVSPYIDVYEAKLSLPSHPAGVFMFLGPTGVGKTHFCEVLGKAMHLGSPGVQIINCGEFTARHEVARIVGSPPGYEGHNDTVPLITNLKITNLIRDVDLPAIIVFDEIEKAHESIHNLLLGILERSALENGHNELVSFDRTLVVMTSNVGAKEIIQTIDGGFGFVKPSNKDIKKTTKQALERQFKPEFLNRIDEVIVFNPLKLKDLEEIVFTELRKYNRHHLTEIKITKAHAKRIARKAFSSKWGAREIKRAVFREVIIPTARKLLSKGKHAHSAP